MTDSTSLPRSAPEAQGISSSAILEFIDAVDRDIQHLHGLMLLRHGHVVAEGWWAPYAPERPHMLFSLSKSFTSTAIGLAVDEGRLTIDAPVLSFFPDKAPASPSANLAAMRVRDLLTMSTGQAHDSTQAREQAGDDWVAAFLAVPVESDPGTRFLYNSGATYMLSAILQRLTGQTLLGYLTPRLFEPLGIQGATWESDPRGINVGGWGLSVTTEDIAKFGQLYLQRGKWGERQIVPAAWVDAASAAQVSNKSDDPDATPDWVQGYGYQFWRCQHNAYRGDGAFGQYCVVMPDQDAVVAINSGLGNMQAVLDLVWRHLLPAMGPARPADDRAHKQLRDRLAGLRLPAQAGSASSAAAAALAGARFDLDANPFGVNALAFETSGDGGVLRIFDEQHEHRISFGWGEWRLGQTSYRIWRSRTHGEPTAASGGRISDEALAVQTWFVETPFRTTTTCRLAPDGQTADITLEINVGFGPTEPVHLRGRRVAS